MQNAICLEFSTNVCEHSYLSEESVYMKQLNSNTNKQFHASNQFHTNNQFHISNQLYTNNQCWASYSEYVVNEATSYSTWDEASLHYSYPKTKNSKLNYKNMAKVAS